MSVKRWSIGRIALIWLGWPLLLCAVLLLALLLGRSGVGIDLEHLRAQPAAGLVLLMLLVAPPLAATWVWARR